MIIRLSNRTIYTNKKGQIHRDDGPAIEWDCGLKEFYIEGKRTLIKSVIAKYYYVDGKFVRRDPPLQDSFLL